MHTKPDRNATTRRLTPIQKKGIDMRVLFIKAGVRKIDIAEKCGVSRFTVRDVCLGISTNAKIRSAISDALGIPAWELWEDIERPAGFITKRGRPKKVA